MSLDISSPFDSEGGYDTEEIWKPHPEHPGYEFSNLGRVYSHISGKFLKGRTKEAF